MSQLLDELILEKISIEFTIKLKAKPYYGTPNRVVLTFDESGFSTSRAVGISDLKSPIERVQAGRMVDEWIVRLNDRLIAESQKLVNTLTKEFGGGLS